MGRKKGCAGAEGDIVDSPLITRSGILDADVEGKKIWAAEEVMIYGGDFYSVEWNCLSGDEDRD